MSDINQCFRCRRDYNDCAHYDNSNNCSCQKYESPINNSKMFGRVFLWTGRIGRLEYALTILASILLFIVLEIGAGIMSVIIPSPMAEVLAFVVLIPPVYIAIVAGIKRAHDTSVSPWYSLTPLIPLFFLNVFTFVIFAAGCIFLFKDAGDEGVNMHGSNPTQPYAEQVQVD